LVESQFLLIPHHAENFLDCENAYPLLLLLYGEGQAFCFQRVGISLGILIGNSQLPCHCFASISLPPSFSIPGVKKSGAPYPRDKRSSAGKTTLDRMEVIHFAIWRLNRHRWRKT
jgi:hypothetical protein